MKNFFKVGVLALVLVLVSGCGSSGSKVLTCTMSENQSGMKMTNTAKITFNSKEATKINLNIDVNLDDSMKSYASMIASSVESQFSELKDQKGVTVKSNTKGSKVTLTIDADLTKMSDKAKEALNLDGATGTYKEAKKDLEKAGFKCK